MTDHNWKSINTQPAMTWCQRCGTIRWTASKMYLIPCGPDTDEPRFWSSLEPDCFPKVVDDPPLEKLEYLRQRYDGFADLELETQKSLAENFVWPLPDPN